jgi:hypothetical protein
MPPIRKSDLWRILDSMLEDLDDSDDENTHDETEDNSSDE